MGTAFDQLDIRIMDLLQSDGRMPFVKIAERLGGPIPRFARGSND